MVRDVGDGKERIYFAWLYRSVLLSVQIRCERMACLDSVKQRIISYSYDTVKQRTI